MTSHSSLKGGGHEQTNACRYLDALCFLLLLDYRYVHNFGHEMLALIFTALFLLHTIWNARWYRALFRGRWPKQRIVMTGIDLLLLFLF